DAGPEGNDRHEVGQRMRNPHINLPAVFQLGILERSRSHGRASRIELVHHCCPPLYSPSTPRHSRAPPSTLEHPPLGGDGRWKRPVPHPDVDEHIASRPDWPETQVEIEPLCCRTNRSG